MIVRLLLVTLFILIALFCWLSLANPVDVDFSFFHRVFRTDLSTLMISSFLLGALLVFLAWLARDVRQTLVDFRRSRKERREKFVRDELGRGMDDLLRGDLAKAKAHFGEVLKRDPSQIDLYLRLSEISLKEEKGDEAFHWLERARLIDIKNMDVLIREAELYKEMKRIDDAIGVLIRAVEIDPGNGKALRHLRQMYLENRRWEEAIRVQRSILKLSKGKEMEEEETLFSTGLKYERARELMDRGGEVNLERALKEAKELVGERKDFLPGLVLLGDVYLRLGKWESAGRIWGKGFIRFKSIIFALRLEELYLSREDPSTLLKIFQRSMRIDPDDWVITFFYAKLCLRLEMLDEALETLDEINVRGKDFPALHRLLAEVYLHKKDFSRAAQEFQRAFEMSERSYLPFYCSTCERESQTWVAYCPQCHRWNSYRIKEGTETGVLPIALSQHRP